MKEEMEVMKPIKDIQNRPFLLEKEMEDEVLMKRVRGLTVSV